MKLPSNLHEKKHLLFWFLGLMENRLFIYLAAILVSTGGMALGRIANAWMVEEIVTAAQTRNTEGLAMQVFGDFIVFVLGWCLWRMGIIHYNIEGRKSKAKVEKMVFSKALRLPYCYYENHHSGDFMSKLIFDTERAGDIYASRLRRLLASVLSAIIYLIPMFCYSPQLTVCLLGVSVLSFIVNSLFLRPMKEVGGRLAGDNSRMTENLTNILSGIELAKLFPAGKLMLRDYREANESCYGTQKKMNQLTAALESLSHIFDLTGSLAFLGIGVWFVGEGLVTLGELTAVYTIYGTFRYVFLDIGKYLPQLMNCIAHVECLYDFLQLEEEAEYDTMQRREDSREKSSEESSGKSSAESRESIEGTGIGRTQEAENYIVEMQNVTFSYNESQKLLENFSLKVPAGKCVALVGESGCGKSTIAKLLLGFYAPEKGCIRVEQTDCCGENLEAIRSRISYVPQEPYLYGVSIAENIAYGRSDVSPEEVPMEDIIQAAQIANAHEFISKLPQGYQTIPGERGNTLSGGERQRIAIARAVIRNAPILLLDEATSALDNESEQLVNEALDRVCRERTTIMIAHRQSTIAMADEVVVL